MLGEDASWKGETTWLASSRCLIAISTAAPFASWEDGCSLALQVIEQPHGKPRSHHATDWRGEYRVIDHSIKGPSPHPPPPSQTSACYNSAYKDTLSPTAKRPECASGNSHSLVHRIPADLGGHTLWPGLAFLLGGGGVYLVWLRTAPMGGTLSMILV